MKRKIFLSASFLILLFLAGCFKSGSGAYTLSGTVCFGGEPETALPEPSPSSFINNSKSFTLNSVAAPAKPPVSLIISCDPKVSFEEQQKIIKNLGFAIKRQQYSDPNSYVVFSTSLSIDEAYQIAKNSPLIKSVEYNYPVRGQSITPDDTYFGRQWDMKIAKFDVAWDNFKGRDYVAVAVIDTGLNTASPEFSGRLTPSNTWYDFVSNDTDPSDNEDSSDNHFSHGTNVAGIIGANPDNNYGYAGAAWDNTKIKIMPLRVLNAAGDGDMSDIINAINWAVDHGANIINLSLGMSVSLNYTPPLSFINAVNKANTNGVTIVCAAGNENSAIDFPACLAGTYPNVIAVGATGYYNQKAWYSCYGPELTVMAPGGDNHIDGTELQQFIWNITYQKFDPKGEVTNIGFIGTSQATPHVSALAALLYSYGITSPEQIRSIISQTATDLGATGWDNRYGYGLINAFAALTATTADITNVTIGIRNGETKQDIVPPAHPNNNGAYSFSEVPFGIWELYAEYTGLGNGYKYYSYIPIKVVNSTKMDFSLKLVPNN